MGSGRSRRAAWPVLLLVLCAAAAAGPAGRAAASPSPPAAAVHAQTTASDVGYWTVAADGSVLPFASAGFGSMGGKQLDQPVVGMAPTPDGQGYWLVSTDGGIFSFGDARFYGSAGSVHLQQPIVGMAADPDTGGYWMVAADGGIFSFDAPFYGSMGGARLDQPIVGMAATPDGHGYWMVAKDGGIFSFGDASFFGSTGNVHLNQPIVGMAADSDTGGYWLVAADGGVFNFGAAFFGSMGGTPLARPMVGLAATPDGRGYWMLAEDGGIFSFGDARFYGSSGGSPSDQPTVGMAPVPARYRLLVVGDSLMAQTGGDLVRLSPPGTAVWVAGGSGSAPCDWIAGYLNPFTDNSFDSFARELQLHHPNVVALAFTGNPGYSGPLAGCVDRSQPYTLDQLLASYRQTMTEMARAATVAGATIYIEASPARNPDVPPGANFNGVPELNRHFSMCRSAPRARPTGGSTTRPQPNFWADSPSTRSPPR